MTHIGLENYNKKVLMMGNEAIARGALEAGVHFCSGYPGNPASEILDVLANISREYDDLYVEWSVNEIVALESAAAASQAGLRALTAMKNLGTDVCSDFLMTVNLAGTRGGLVLIVGDDPAAHSTTTELDTRNYARFAQIPLLEPATIQESKDMTKWAFELSEDLDLICMLRTVTRLSHSRGVVTLSKINRIKKTADINPEDMWTSGSSRITCMLHSVQLEKMKRAQQIFEGSRFNWYSGREDADFVIITSGTGWLYSYEAVKLLKLDKEVGILKLGTTWPLPEKFVTTHLKHASEVLFVEEIDPFLEQNVKMLYAEVASGGLSPIRFYGKRSNHVQGEFGAGTGELNVDIIIKALIEIKNMAYTPVRKEFLEKTQNLLGSYVPPRTMGFCAGCPHRASMWIIKKALKWDGREGIVTGDIGCYSLALLPTGFSVAKTLHCMGAGIGIANGFGNLKKFRLNKPVIALAGDSTFYHACIPALINACWNGSNILLVVLDNLTTAMTGHQPHPGTGSNALGFPSPKISIENICKAIGAKVEICDPFNLNEAVEKVYKMLQEEGVKVIIFRRECPLPFPSEKRKRVYVDQDKCIGKECGCMAFCTRVLGCPGNIWDYEREKAQIDETICNGCGLCAEICPANAIRVEEVS